MMKDHISSRKSEKDTARQTMEEKPNGSNIRNLDLEVRYSFPQMIRLTEEESSRLLYSNRKQVLPLSIANTMALGEKRHRGETPYAGLI